MNNLKKIYLGADHRGYELKEKIASYLLENKILFEDMGAETLDTKDDYTIYAERVASMVAENNNTLGILFCGSGVGVDIVANKFDGIRASIGKNKDQVKAGRIDDNMNILVIAADFTSIIDAKNMVDAFLQTPYEKNAKHERRLEDIKRIEENN